MCLGSGRRSDLKTLDAPVVLDIGTLSTPEMLECRKTNFGEITSETTKGWDLSFTFAKTGTTNQSDEAASHYTNLIQSGPQGDEVIGQSTSRLIPKEHQPCGPQTPLTVPDEVI